MQVSVIIPVYNAEPFLEKAVHSGIEQKETGEILLVEDGSTDNSLELCHKLAGEHSKVQLLFHGGNQNQGAGASRNLGIKNAQYPFLAFLDADDYYLPGRFTKDVEVFEQFSDAEGVYSGIGTHYHTRNPAIQARFKKREFTSLKELIDPDDLFFRMTPMGNAGHFSLNGLTIKKEAIAKAGVFLSSLKLSQDTHFRIKLAAVCRLYPGEIDKAVAMRGIHDENRSISIKNIQGNYHCLMFRDLIDWGKKRKLGREKIGRLWLSYYRVFNRKHDNANMAMKLRFILMSAVQWPGLLKSKELRQILLKF